MADNSVIIRVRVNNGSGPGLGAARSDLDQFVRHADGRLRDLRGRYVSESRLAGQGMRELAVSGDVVRDSMVSLIRNAAIVGWAGPATAAIAQLVGVLLTVPAGLAAAGAIFGTFKMITGGLTDAIGAELPAAAAAGGQSARAMARQIEAAQRQIADAERGVVQAERQLADSHRAVERASRDYSDALADEQRAQSNVAKARRDAQRTLDELNESVRDSALDQQSATLGLLRAQQRLSDVQRDSSASTLDRAEASLAVTMAQERVRDADREATQAAEQLSEAQAKGIEGSDQVTAANEALVQAQRRVSDAAQGVADAHQGVADAEANLQQAHQGVADAVQNLADVQAQQAETARAAAAGTNAYAEAMAKLSPEAQQLVRQLRELKPAWEDVEKSVQDRGLRGMAEDVKSLADTYLPVLKTGLGGIADQLNSMAAYAIDQVLDPAAVADVNTILSNTAGFVDQASTAVGDLVAGFLDLAGVGSQYLPEFGGWIAGLVSDFREWVAANGGAGGAIEGWITTAVSNLQALWEIGSNVFDIVSAIATGLSGGEGGQSFLEFVQSMTDSLAEFAESDGVQATLTIIGAIARILLDTLPIWGPVVAGVWLLIEAIRMWSVVQLLLNLAMNANPIFLIVTLIGLLVGALIYAWNNSETFRNIVLGVWEAIKTGFKAAIDGIVSGFNWLRDALSKGAEFIGRVLGGMWDGLKNGAKGAVNGAIFLLNKLIEGANVVVRGLNMVNPFSDIPYIPYVPYLARGGVASGLAVVGERGRELVRLPTGSTVIPNGQTEAMLAGAGGGGGGGGLRLIVDGTGGLADLIMSMVRKGDIRLEPAS